MKYPTKRTDEQIAVMVKNKLANLIETSKDVDAVVALANAFTKLRAVEMKADEGDWGQELPKETRSLNSEPAGNSSGS